MINLTEAVVDSLAPNAAAIKNGKGLVKKNSFPLLQRSEDGTILFGECKGSGKTPYRCSVDWLKAENPVFRCTCPSRQFPCKHNLGLMYAYVEGKAFEVAPIPEEIVEKREKVEKREEKKKEAASSDAPAPKRKTNKTALKKKIAAQLEGIEIAEKLMLQLVQSGLGSVDKKILQTTEEQVKQLGNYYIPGIQTAFREVTLQLGQQEDAEKVYDRVLERLFSLQVLIKRSKEHLQNRLDEPDALMDTETTLEERIGHAWQMAELREYGRTRQNVELLQLAFRSYEDQARGEYVDEAYWLELAAGEVHLTRNYRPFRAAKYIREEDSVFQVIQAKELAHYPGEMNARVRWEEAALREIGSSDYEQVRSFASSSVPDVIKKVKNQIKNPLSDKNPVMLLKFALIRQADTSYILLDDQGKQLPLADIAALGEPTSYLLSFLPSAALEDQVMLVMFEHDLQNNRLKAHPLSIITRDDIIRLLY